MERRRRGRPLLQAAAGAVLILLGLLRTVRADEGFDLALAIVQVGVGIAFVLIAYLEMRRTG